MQYRLDEADEVERDARDSWRVPGHSRARGFDPTNKRMLLIAAGVGCLLAAVTGVWSMSGHRSSTIPVIQADSRPIRVKPENPGGLQVTGGDEFMAGEGDPGSSRMAPGAEAPAPNVLRAEQADPPQAQLTNLAVPATTQTMDMPKQPAPAQRAVAAAPAAPASSAPVAPAPAAAGKGTLVQLAALGSEDAAKAEWAQLNKKMPDLLGGRQPNFSRTDRDGKTYWRVRTGGFTDLAQATNFCERARAKGAACSIASF